MAGGPPFAKEKQEAVSGPAGAATSTAPVVNAKPVVVKHGPGLDPSVTPPYSKLRVRSRYECVEMEGLAGKSKTFRDHLAELQTRRRTMDYRVKAMDPRSGGGKTEPDLPRGYIMTIAPGPTHPRFPFCEGVPHQHRPRPQHTVQGRRARAAVPH